MKSLEEHLHDLFWTQTSSQPWLKHVEQNCVSITTLKLICKSLSTMHVTFDLYQLEERQVVGTFSFCPY